MRKPSVNQKFKKRRGYFDQAVDDTSVKPSTTTKNAKNLGEWINAKSVEDKDDYRKNTYTPIIKKLSSNKWKTEGIADDDDKVKEGYKAGYLSTQEYNRATSLISRRLMEARNLKVKQGDQVVDGRKLVTGRQYVPNVDQSEITNLRMRRTAEFYKQQRKIASADDSLSAIGIGKRAISTAGGLAAGMALGATKSVLNLGRNVTFNEVMNDWYTGLDEQEKKYNESVAQGADENIFLENAYGASAGVEQLTALPAILGGEAGKYVVGRGLGMLQGQTAQQADDVYDTLGLMNWYREKTGDETNLTRQVSRVAAMKLGTNVASAGAGLATMNVAGQAFAAALKPVASSMAQFQALKSAGMFLPGLTSAVGTSGVPGQAVRGMGGNREQSEIANKAFEIAGSPLESAASAIPMVSTDIYGNKTDLRAQEQDIQQQVDPYGLQDLGTTLAMFSGGTAGFYKEAKKLYQVSRMLSRVNGSTPGKFAAAGQKLARQKAELMGSVGPDAAFALNNVFHPVAQTYRAATDATVDKEGNRVYQPPTALDLGKAALLTFGATRPHAKFAPYIQPALRGKPLFSGVDMNAQAYYAAKDYVDGGDWRSSFINKRFKELTGRDAANVDDIKRVSSAIYGFIRRPAMEQLTKGRILPQHALESMFVGLASGRGFNHESAEVAQARVDNLIRSMRDKGDDNPLADGNPLVSEQINPKLYVLDPVARKQQIAEVQKQILADMQKAVADSEQAPTDAPTQEQKPEPTNKFYAVRIEDGEDGTPQYLAYNSHASGYGHTFRSAELVRGDQDMSDLIDISSSANMAKKRIYTSEDLARVVAADPDILNPLTNNKWKSDDGESIRTIGGFREDGSVIIKSYNSTNGQTSEETMSSIAVAREIAVQNPKLSELIGGMLEAMNTNKTELADVPEYSESRDFPDRVAYTSTDGQTKDVNGRLISTFGTTSPMGVFQLQSGAIYVQPIRDTSVRTKIPLTSRQIDSSPEAMNARTLSQSRRAVDVSEGYLDLDIHNMGVPTRVLLTPDHVELVKVILESDLPDTQKAEAIRNAVSEALVLDMPRDLKSYRFDESNELVQDTDVLPGDVVIGNFDPNATSDQGQKAVVIKSDAGLVTVKLLTDPEGIAYTTSADKVVQDTRHNREDLNDRLNNFTPTEETPQLRPWKRATADEEEIAIFVAAKHAVDVQKEIRSASKDNLPTIIRTYVRDSKSMPDAVKSGLIIWAAVNQDTEAVIDTLVSLYDDAVSEKDLSISYLNRISDIYGDENFIQALYTIDTLSETIPSAALMSAKSIEQTATTRAIARRMNQILFKGNNKLSANEAFKRAIKSLNIDADRAKKLENDAKAESIYMRGIAPQSLAHVDKVWQMKRVSGMSLDAQVRLGRAIASTSTIDSRDNVVSAGFDVVLADFWKGEQYFNKALSVVKSALANEQPTDAQTTEQKLRDLGLDFLYYAAIDNDQKLVRRILTSDVDAYRRFQRESNLYIANTVIPRMILDVVGQSVDQNSFLGFSADGSVDQTNELAFLEVLNKYGRDITELIDRSELPDNDKESISNALVNLMSQVTNDPAIAKRVSTYTPKADGTGIDVVLRDGESVTNITAIDSIIAIDTLASDIMSQAIVDDALSSGQQVKLSRSSEAPIDPNSPVPTGIDNTVAPETAKSDIESQDEAVDFNTTIADARRLNIKQLSNVTQFAKTLRVLQTFKISNVDAHIDRYAPIFGLDVARANLQAAKASGDTTAINAAYQAEFIARRNTFKAAFSYLETVIDKAKTLELLFVEDDAPEFSTALAMLENAFETVSTYYTAPSLSDTSFMGFSNADIAGGKLIAGGDEGNNVETQTFENTSQEQIDFITGEIARVSSDTTLSRSRKATILADLESARTKLKQYAESQKKQGQTEDFRKALVTSINRFNNSLGTVPDTLIQKFADSPENILAIQVDILKDMLSAMSSDALHEYGTSRASDFGQSTISLVRNVSRTVKDTLTFYQDIARAQEVSVEQIDGQTIVNIFGQQRDISDIRTLTDAVDRLNEDRVKIEPTTTIDDAMFVPGQVEQSVADFVGEDPSVVTYLLSSDSDFNGMASPTRDTASKASLYAMHARNYAGMRQLLRQMLISELGGLDTDARSEIVSLSGNKQVRMARDGYIVGADRVDDLGNYKLSDPDVIETARGRWKVQLTKVLNVALSRGLEDQGGITVNAVGKDRAFVAKIIDRVNNLFDNSTQFKGGNVIDLVRATRQIVEAEIANQRSAPTEFQNQLLAKINENALLNLWSARDKSGSFGTYTRGYVDTPHEIATTIRALAGASEESVPYLTNNSGRYDIYSVPVDGDMKTLRPAMAKVLFDLYDKLDLDGYTEQQIDQIKKIKQQYMIKMQQDQYKAAQKLSNDAAMIDRLATGMAKLYDNFAFGHANDKLSMLLGSQQPQHREEVINGLRAVGVRENIIQRFIEQTATSFAQFLGDNRGVGTSIMTPEQINAFRTYMLARGRQDYYLNSGRVLFTTQKVMNETNVRMRRHTPDNKEIFGALVGLDNKADRAVHKLMMLAGDMSADRNAATLVHEMSHVLFHGVSDVNQFSLVDALVPEGKMTLDKINDSHPLFPVLLQLQAAREYKAKNGELNLKAAWSTIDSKYQSVDGISLLTDWHPYAHEMFASGLLSTIANFEAPMDANAAMSMDRDAAAIFQEIAGPLRSVWASIARESPMDILRTADGKFQQQWTSPIPKQVYSAGRSDATKNRRKITYPQLRQGDYISINVPLSGTLQGRPYVDMYTPKDVVSMWINQNFGQAHGHTYGFDMYMPNGTRINSPIKDLELNKLLIDKISRGELTDYDIYFQPIGSMNRTPVIQGDEYTVNQRWGQRLQGRVVDQLVFINPRTNKGQYTKAFVDTRAGVELPFTSVTADSQVDKDGFFPTRLHFTQKEVGLVSRVGQSGIESDYTTVPTQQTYYVVETPVVLSYRDGGKIRNKRTTVRMLVSAEALMDVDGVNQPRLHGYSGEYNQKFSAVLYDLNRRISRVQANIVHYADYSDQIALEKKIVAGTSTDFQGNRPSTEKPADRIAAYYADQYKHVRAAGVDMRSMMKVGRASIESDIVDFMATQGMINDAGGLTESGRVFIESLNTNSLNKIGDFVYNNGLFRMSVGRDMMMYDSRYTHDGEQFNLEVNTPEYMALSDFFDSLDKAIDYKTSGMTADERAVMLEDFAFELFYAFSRPITDEVSKKAYRNKSSVDRVNDVVNAFNEGLPDELKISTSSVQDYNGQPTSIDVMSVLEMPIRGNDLGDFITTGVPLQLLDIRDAVTNGETIKFSDNYYRSTAAAYALSRVRDVVFGRANIAGYNMFLKQLADPNPDVHEKANQLLFAATHILDLQEREISSARYNWKSQGYTLVSNSFKTNKKVIMRDGSGAHFEVDFARNESRPVVQDPGNPNTLIYGDVIGNRYPVSTSGARMKFSRANNGVLKVDFDINTLSPIEKTSYMKDGSVVFMRNRAIHDPLLPEGIYLYRVSSPIRTKILDPKTTIDPEVPYTLELMSNPFMSYRSFTNDAGEMSLQSVQEYRQQSPSELIRLAAAAYLPDASPMAYERLENLTQNTVVPRDIYIAKMLVAEAEAADPKIIPEEWRTRMGSDYRVAKVLQPEGDQEYSITQSAIVNNSRSRTWLSSGDIFEDGVAPFTQEEMDLLDGLEPYDSAKHSDPIEFDKWRQQRYSDIVDRMFLFDEPENIIVKNDPNNKQVGISVNGKDVYMAIPTAEFDGVMNTLFSSGNGPSPVSLTPNQMHALRYRIIPGRTKLNRLLSGLWTEYNAGQIVTRLSLDFSRPLIQNFMVSFLDPKNTAMQFYGLAGLLPNIPKPGAAKSFGTTVLQRLASKTLGHTKDWALGDRAYHGVIEGLFKKYGTPGSKIGYLIPGMKRTVKGHYVKPVVSGISMPRRQYTIADLNELGLSTQYGEWFESAAAMQALNPSMDLKDIPVQLTQSEHVGKGVIAQRIPLVGQTERGGVLSTDVLRIKIMLEYIAYVDDNLTAFALGDNPSEGQLNYVAEQYKRNFARVLNTLTGVPTGTDPGLSPTLQDKYHLASQVWLAPNWFKAVGNITLVPAALQLAAGMVTNELLRGVSKRLHGGIGYNVVDVGPQARFFDSLVFNTPQAGTMIKTGGKYYAMTMARVMLGLIALQQMATSQQAVATYHAIGKRIGVPSAQTIWTNVSGIQPASEDAKGWRVTNKKWFDFQNPREFGRVTTIGDAQINYPAAIMGWQKLLINPTLNINQRIELGTPPWQAVAEEMAKVYVVDRLNPGIPAAYSMYSGGGYDGAPIAQKHPGFEMFRHNKEAVYRALEGNPYKYALMWLDVRYPNGISRFAANHEILPLQNLLKDLEAMIYKQEGNNLEFDPQTYNLRASMFGRMVGIENSYSNQYLEDMSDVTVGKMKFGQYMTERRKYEYNYPNAFDVINQYGLRALWEGIPNDGQFIQDSDMQYPGMPTKEIILQSEQTPDRFMGRIIPRYKKKIAPMSDSKRDRINQ